MSGAAQNAAKSSALNLGVVVAVALRVSVMVPPGSVERSLKVFSARCRGTITSEVIAIGNKVVGMALNVEMVTFDCVDPAQLAEWWAQQFEGETQELIPGEFIAVIRADGPRLGFQKVDDPTPGKNRVHLDFGAADVDAEVSRLTSAGATEVGRHSIGDNFRWVVLADPAGNAFCVAGTG
jgi:predicted enzyme related to lactoylglutathione lyase